MEHRVRITPLSNLDRRHQRIRRMAQHGLLTSARVDKIAADRAICDAADGEYVRVWPLRGTLDHLFDGRVVTGIDLRVGGGGTRTDVARRAEVDEHRSPVRPDQDVCGLDIAMQKPG